MITDFESSWCSMASDVPFPMIIRLSTLTFLNLTLPCLTALILSACTETKKPYPTLIRRWCLSVFSTQATHPFWLIKHHYLHANLQQPTPIPSPPFHASSDWTQAGWMNVKNCHFAILVDRPRILCSRTGWTTQPWLAVAPKRCNTAPRDWSAFVGPRASTSYFCCAHAVRARASRFYLPAKDWKVRYDTVWYSTAGTPVGAEAMGAGSWQLAASPQPAGQQLAVSRRAVRWVSKISKEAMPKAR